MPTSTEIANLALRHIGETRTISDIATDTSFVARICNQFFETERDITLREFSWPFATKIATLGLIEEDPNANWDYRYGYPSDCVYLRNILSGTRNERADTVVPYKIDNSSGVKTILTDKEDAELEYTMRVTDTSLFPADFVEALSYRLAAKVAPAVAGPAGDKLATRVLQLYSIAIAKAQNTAANEEQRDIPPDSEFIRERG